MSADEAFFDSNVLIYLTDEASGKSGRTEDLLADGGVISVQVLNEFANVARRKVQLSWVETRDFLDTFRATLEIVPLTLETHERGLDLAERYHLRVYDGMIVAAALLAGCTTLYSEDMHDGLAIDRLTIRNPYAGGPGG
jgi:predicted nucleic acid-binding protein